MSKTPLRFCSPLLASRERERRSREDPRELRRLWESGWTETERIERLFDRDRLAEEDLLRFLERLAERVERRPLERDRRDSPSLRRPSSRAEVPLRRRLLFLVRSRKKNPR